MHLVRSRPQALAKQITKYYGNITAENTIQGIVPIVQTGDVHAVVYDLTDQVGRRFMIVNQSVIRMLLYRIGSAY